MQLQKEKPGKIQACWYLNLASAIPEQPSNQIIELASQRGDRHLIGL